MEEKSLKNRPSADEIAEMADKGEDISRFFTSKGRMMPPMQMVRRTNKNGALPEPRAVSSE